MADSGSQAKAAGAFADALERERRTGRLQRPWLVAGPHAPAGDRGTREAMAQSFRLANMMSQNPKQNGMPWDKIEEGTRRYVMRARANVYVVTGKVFQPSEQRTGVRGVAVPSRVFKLVFDPSIGKSWAHGQQNDPSAQNWPSAPACSCYWAPNRTEMHYLRRPWRCARTSSAELPTALTAACNSSSLHLTD
ncbi:DNA/RNA non-specific endonuclease [Acidovorax sp. WCS2018Cala2-18]|uniref:DNA/RNA non-specific endonuclease n=1 Tax=unclassified Acidovorax TaxID=2684926 RepID=UPI0038571CD8